MSDPKSTLKSVAKIAPGIIDVVSDGALTDLKNQIWPDINGIITAAGNKAFDSMLMSTLIVARYLAAAIHDVEPDAEEVKRFFDEHAKDPGFPARTARLLRASLHAPRKEKRRMLALALFRPPSEPITRDAVDAAVESLQPEDVEVLRRLVEDDPDAVGHYVGHRTPDARRKPGGASFGSEREVLVTRTGRENRIDEKHVWPCSIGSLTRLRGADCLDIMALGSPAEDKVVFVAIRRVDVLPLGRDVLGVLKDLRAVLDIEASEDSDDGPPTR